jgi:hypothetical protein
MKQNYTIDASSSRTLDEQLIRQIVFHEAGHAAAIYLYNKQKQLPSVDFQITIKKADRSQAFPFASRTVKHDHFVAMVEGGCLTQNLPVALIESTDYFALNQQDTYRTALIFGQHVSTRITYWFYNVFLYTKNTIVCNSMIM